MPIARSTLTGAVAGVVLLAGAVGFGAGLPKVIDDPGATSADLPTLPDSFDERFVGLSSVTPEQASASEPQQVEQIEAIAEAAQKTEEDTDALLAEEYGDAAVRTYLDVRAAVAAQQTGQAPAQFIVTVVPGEAGLLTPRGPLAIDNPGFHYELEQIDGHRCATILRDPVDPMTGQPTGAEPTAADYEVTCRAERDGVAYELASSGLAPEEAGSYFDRLLELTEG